MSDKEKEIYILKFIYNVLTDDRNANRYAGTRVGDITTDKNIGLSDCINYIEHQFAKAVEE